MSVESIVNLAAGKLAEIIDQEAKFLYGVKGRVQSLQDELKWMSSFLKDMEAIGEEEGGDERSRTLITEIRKIAYDAEDAVESYILRVENVDLFKKYGCFCFHLWKTHQLGNEVETIKVRISDTMDRLKKYKGDDGVNGGRRENLEQGFRRRRRISYSHNNEDHVIGLNEDIEKLVGLLTTSSELQVFSVMGMGGSGKTTLVRKLYNHENVKGHFECLVWVSISEQWVALHVLFDILRKVSGKTMNLDESWSIENVVGKLQEFLERKKYLIVLDDVWTREALDEILPALPLGNDGRKIIVTTRMRELVDYPDLKCRIHESRRLTDEESWELFRKIAFYHREEDMVTFKELGKEMLKKCEGLPLAVVALAGILSKKETVEEWEKVRYAVSSKIMEFGRGTHEYGNVKEMLALSYNDLPYELKPCFLYLALFPEDYEIPVGMIIRMWIAEGFIGPDQVQEGDTLEDVAREYLDELIHRYVIRVASRNYQGKVKSVQMHDLMRDFCIKKAKEQEFLQVCSSDARSSTQSRRTIIHSYNRMYFPFPSEDRHLRSLFLFAQANVRNYKMQTLEEDRPKLSFMSIHKNFKLLRVLNLVGINTSDGALPKEIGSLIHLRYLGLRVTNIHQLPSSIGNLRNLLTLDYRGLEEFDRPVKVPNVLWKLEGLQHLYLPFNRYNRSSMEMMKFHRLKHLQTLWGVGGGDWILDELPRLSQSVQKLSVEGIGSVEQLEAAFQCPSIKIDSFRTLYLDWLIIHEGGEFLSKNNLESIVQCQHLRKLRLRGRIEDKLACVQFPSRINKLELLYTQLEAEATLGCIGKLPNLKYLRLLFDSYMGVKWTCTSGEFLQLRYLKLLDVRNLEEWSIQRGAMPQLKRLSMCNCGNLSRIPQGLKFITILEELKFNYMSDKFYNKIKGGEDAHIIQHIPVVRYLD